MARITVEDCLRRENNRFALVLLASRRTKQLLSGSRVLLSEQRSNKAVVTALREIASGQVRFMTAEERQTAEEAKIRAQQEARANAAAHAAATTAPGDDLFLRPASKDAAAMGSTDSGSDDSTERPAVEVGGEHANGSVAAESNGTVKPPEA